MALGGGVGLLLVRFTGTALLLTVKSHHFEVGFLFFFKLKVLTQPFKRKDSENLAQFNIFQVKINRNQSEIQIGDTHLLGKSHTGPQDMFRTCVSVHFHFSFK